MRVGNLVKYDRQFEQIKGMVWSINHEGGTTQVFTTYGKKVWCVTSGLEVINEID
jgi:hypothetical protein